jgi:pathogenesis-related protein 1
MNRRTAVSIVMTVLILPAFQAPGPPMGRADGRELKTRAGKPGAVPSKTGSRAVGSRLKGSETRTLLRLHNKARSDVGVRPLVWSNRLAAYAQRWADHLAATGCRMEHRPSSGKWRRIYGENLFMGTAGYYGVGDAVQSWVEEKKDYRGRALNSSNWHAAGHYTQVVWRGTRRVGCAKKVCNGMVIVVCNYDPPGNVLGESPY